MRSYEVRLDSFQDSRPEETITIRELEGDVLVKFIELGAEQARRVAEAILKALKADSAPVRIEVL